MRKLMTIAILVFFLSTFSLFAKSVDNNMALKVAETKLKIDNKDNYLIKNYEKILSEEGELSGHLYSLNPNGFIIVSIDTDLNPIIAYSYKNNYSTDDGPLNLSYHWIRKEMQLRKDAISFLGQELKKENNNVWQKYAEADYGYFESKNRQIWPEPGTTSTGGWIETTWNQDPYPYNTYCPLDPSNGQRCVTGCVATAIAQIINYERYIGDPTFSSPGDDYISNYTSPSIYIDDDATSLDFPNFSTLTNYMQDIKDIYYSGNDPLTNHAIGVLNFAAGVAVEMNYSSSASGSYSSLARNALLYKFDYDSANLYSENPTTFYDMLSDNMQDAQPCYLSIFGGGGHAIIADGYNSGDDTYHLNFGWGGNSDGWYTLPDGMPAGFTEVDAAIMDIGGGFLPYLEYDLTYVNENSGDGDGVLNPGESADLRIQIANKENFDTATDVSATLSSSDPRVTITDPDGSYNNISPGAASVNLADPFSVEVQEGIGACSIDFTLHIESNSTYSIDIDFTIDVTLDQKNWPINITNGVLGSPVFYNDGVIFADKNGNIHRYDYEAQEHTNFPYDTGNQIYGSVAIADIDDDNSDEIIAGSRSNNLYVINMDGSEEFTYSVPMNILCTPVVADLEQDGSKEIIFQTITGNLYVIDSSGNDLPNFPVQLSSYMNMDAGVAVADINEDGKQEIVVGLLDGQVSIVDVNGNITGNVSTSGAINSSPTIVKFNTGYKIVVGTAEETVAIINSDGILENEFSVSGEVNTSPVVLNMNNSEDINDLIIFVGSNNGDMNAVYWDGTPVDSWPFTAGGAIESTPVIADIDSDGIQDVIFGSTDKNLYAVNMNGDEIENFPIQNDNSIQSSPSISDFDNDDDYEIAIGTNNSIWVVDYKIEFTEENILWNMYKKNLHRTSFIDCSYQAGVNDDPNITNRTFIKQNFPNPIVNNTSISYNLKPEHAKNAKIKIYNIIGQNVDVISELENGQNTISWNAVDAKGNRLSNGIYFYRLESNNYSSDVRKMVIMK